MDRRRIPLLTLVLGVAIGVGIALVAMRSPDPPSQPDAAGARVDIALEDPPEGTGDLPRLPPEGLLPPEAETHPEYFQEEPAPEDPPQALPAEIDYPRLEKLAVESEVPHRSLGAWDEAPDSSTPGARRAFIMVVDPQISDPALEALARDLRDQHRDARNLNVRIFDSEEGARRARWVDGGALAHRHLVAQVTRNEGMGVDTIRIRGRLIEP